jgi:predicted ribosome quality control (RQC) complex YloA/Tae2 family protein
VSELPENPSRLKALVPLHWQEVALLAAQLEVLKGQVVRRIFAAQAASLSGDFYPHDYWLEFGNRLCLNISLRPNWVYLRLSRLPRVHLAGSQFGFLSLLRKFLEGKTLLEVKQRPFDRIIELGFQGQVSCVLFLFPTHPNAQIFDQDAPVAQLKALRAFAAAGTPGASRPVRPALEQGALAWDRFIEQMLVQSAFEDRRSKLLRLLAAVQKKLEPKIEHFKKSDPVFDSGKLNSPASYGKLMQQHFGIYMQEHTGSAFLGVKKLMLEDFESGHKVEIPVNPGLSYSQQMEVFFSRAKKARQKLEQHRAMRHSLLEKQAALNALKEALLSLESADLDGLAHLESQLEGPVQLTEASHGYFSGVSLDGFRLAVGRSLRENLALTFDVARPFDIWMHLKGMQSAHGIIFLASRAQKSCSLEALLDCAHVILHYSVKNPEGKWEFDYTWQKRLKKIKKSEKILIGETKTLMVQFEPQRLKRLLASKSLLA